MQVFWDVALCGIWHSQRLDLRLIAIFTWVSVRLPQAVLGLLVLRDLRQQHRLHRKERRNFSFELWSWLGLLTPPCLLCWKNLIIQSLWYNSEFLGEDTAACKEAGPPGLFPAWRPLPLKSCILFAVEKAEQKATRCSPPKSQPALPTREAFCE